MIFKGKRDTARVDEFSKAMTKLQEKKILKSKKRVFGVSDTHTVRHITIQAIFQMRLNFP